MEIKLLVIFILLNIINVIIQTIKSLVTIKCGKILSSIVNAVAYGLYTIVVVYTVCELPLFIKVFVVAMTNLIGVFVVKLIEEKTRKDRLWKIETTIKSQANIDELKSQLNHAKVSYNFFNIGNNLWICNCYCYSQENSTAVKKILKNCNAKYFASESKIL